MKKTTKTTKTPAPAKKSKQASPKAPAAPAVKKTAPKAITTCIAAQIDVGFGNTLYLRGDGPGLSWEKGVIMECVADDRWSITLPESSRPILCKFLINDETWCAGEDYLVKPGQETVFVPSF